MNTILIVAAHPDDEILGCGGTVSKFVNEGYNAHTLILGEGVTSRNVSRDVEKDRKKIDLLREQIHRANEKIGVKSVSILDFPDNRFDSVDFLDIVKSIERIKNEIHPSIIFTHYLNDLNIDHRITSKAVLTATRPTTNESVKDVFSFEVLSSTEWNYPQYFSPNVYFDITKTIQNKKNAMLMYQSELCDYPHPRSIEGIDIQARHRGLQVGMEYCESFFLLRSIK